MGELHVRRKLAAQRTDEHLSSLTITIVYAVYAIGIVLSFLLAGHISDWYGPRAVLIPALAVAVAAALVFLVWKSLPGCSSRACSQAWRSAWEWPPPPRSYSGPAGVATRPLGIVATIANVGGAATGPLIAGLLARYEPHGPTLPFIVFLAAAVLAVSAPEGHAALHPDRRITRSG